MKKRLAWALSIVLVLAIVTRPAAMAEAVRAVARALADIGVALWDFIVNLAP